MDEARQSNFFPKMSPGKWAGALAVFFLIGAGVSILFVNGLGLLSFDDRWWDITVPIVFSAIIAAFILGILAIRKYKDSAVSLYLSVVLGLLAILFVIFHSLFISD